MACSANPQSSATSSVCSTSPPVKADTSVVGMIPSRNSGVLSAPPALACASPALRAASVRCSPLPGSSRLPTSRPMASATVDMTMK